MGGGLLQLVSYGVADIHLTGNPQISFFKTVYQNHTNFVIETIEVQFEQHPNFGSKASITIPRQGDLISKMVLQFTLPALKQIQNSSTYVHYCNSVAHALLDTIELEIGGQIIDTQYGEWLEIWNELTLEESKQGLIWTHMRKWADKNNIPAPI